MRALESAEECVGKTVAGAHDDGCRIALSFTDDTALVLELDHGYYDDVSLSICGEDDLDPHDKVSLGIASTADIASEENRKRDDEAARIATEERHARDQYERLKKRFEQQPELFCNLHYRRGRFT